MISAFCVYINRMHVTYIHALCVHYISNSLDVINNEAKVKKIQIKKHREPIQCLLLRIDTVDYFLLIKHF